MNAPGTLAGRSGGEASASRQIASFRQQAEKAEAEAAWAKAIGLWRSARALAPEEPDVLAKLARALIGGGRPAEACEEIEAAGPRFGTVFELAFVHALALQEQGKLGQALEGWRHVRRSFPDHPLAYAAESAILYTRGSFGEAEAVLKPALERFPGDFGILVQAVLVAYARDDLATAISRLDALEASCLDHPTGAATASNLRKLLPKSTPAPTDPAAIARHAQAAGEARNWEEAARYWREFFLNAPDDISFIELAADAFVQAGAPMEAVALLASAYKKHPDRIDFVFRLVSVAQAADNWADAALYWDDLVRILPDNIDIRSARGFAVWRANAKDETEEGSAPRPAQPVRAPSNGHEEDLRQLMLSFEGLGDDCEFGLVQRHFGAEPLGLFRFSAIGTSDLVGLLDQRFECLGDPDHTRIVWESNEFIVRDMRGYYRMHTFMQDETIEQAKLLAKQIKRINFLKREIVEDLVAGEKIFVCKDSAAPISDDTLRQISARLRRYGDNTLLGMRRATPGHPAGSIERLEQGIMIGYLSSMYNNGLQSIDFPSWRQVLTSARHLRGVASSHI